MPSERSESTTQPERGPTGAGVGSSVPRQPAAAAGGEVGATGAGMAPARGGDLPEDRGDRATGPDPAIAGAAPGVPGGTDAGTEPTPSGGDRTATRASDLTDDPDPGGGSGLDSRGDIAADMDPEPRLGGDR